MTTDSVRTYSSRSREVGQGAATALGGAAEVVTDRPGAGREAVDLRVAGGPDEPVHAAGRGPVHTEGLDAVRQVVDGSVARRLRVDIYDVEAVAGDQGEGVDTGAVAGQVALGGGDRVPPDRPQQLLLRVVAGLPVGVGPADEGRDAGVDQVVLVVRGVNVDCAGLTPLAARPRRAGAARLVHDLRR